MKFAKHPHLLFFSVFVIDSVFGVKDPEYSSLTAEMEIVTLEDMSQETPSSLPESTSKNMPPKSVETLKEQYASYLKSLGNDLQSRILDYVPEFTPAMVLSRTMLAKDFRTEGLLQKYFAEVYMIPELANLPYHVDLMALDNASFEFNEEGRVKAFKHLLKLLAFSFRNSPIRKELTLIVLNADIARDVKINQGYNPDQKDDFKSIVIKDEYLTDFFGYSLKLLFEARSYTAFVHLLLASRAPHLFPETPNKTQTFWHESPNFLEIVADMFVAEPVLFKEHFFRNLTHRIPPDQLLAVYDMLLKEIPGGAEYILRDENARNHPLKWAQCLFAIDYSGHLDLAHDVYSTMDAILLRNRHVFTGMKEVDQRTMLEMRFNNGPLCIPTFTEYKIVVVEILIAMNRYEDAIRVFDETHTPWEKCKFAKMRQFHRYMIENHFDIYQFRLTFDPSLVGYDLDSVYRYYQSSSLSELLNNGYFKFRSIFSRDYQAHISKLIYLHLSLDDFKAFLASIFGSVHTYNLNALIEIKGDSSDFMDYFAMFVTRFREHKGCDDFFHLKPENMEKLQRIPSALELLLENLEFIGKDIFLELLSYERSYELLRAQKDTLIVVNKKGLSRYDSRPLIMNETVHRRVIEFASAEKLAAEIAQNVAVLHNENADLNAESTWKYSHSSD